MSMHLLGGVVRGETVHMECATDEEQTVTWLQFFTKSTLTRDQAALVCDRCGNTIGEGKKQ